MRDCKDAHDPARMLGSHWVPISGDTQDRGKERRMELVSDAFLGSNRTPKWDLAAGPAARLQDTLVPQDTGVSNSFDATGAPLPAFP